MQTWISASWFCNMVNVLCTSRCPMIDTGTVVAQEGEVMTICHCSHLSVYSVCRHVGHCIDLGVVCICLASQKVATPAAFLSSLH